jgi:hypothetical protein
MDTNNEILDAIEILADKKIGENITKILTGICKSVNINNNTCVMDSNGVISTVQFYGSPPEVNELYRIFVPSNNMSRSFIVVPPKFTVNPNLLDNWYFGNPVNQRGKTEYTGTITYTIDRWIQGFDGTLTSTLTDDGIKIVAGNDGTYKNFEQVLSDVPTNSTFTLSFLVNDYTSVNQIYIVGIGIGQFDIKDNLISLTFKTGSSILGRETFGIQVKVGKTVTIKAAKLELGSTQTLAHLENGNWVLNEIPDYGEQLRKCQRYYYQVHYTQYQTINMAYEDTAYAFLMLPLPVEMRLKYPVMTQSAPILLGTSEKTLVSAEVSGCMARLGLNYDAMTKPSRSCYSYCPNVSGVTFTFSADL